MNAWDILGWMLVGLVGLWICVNIVLPMVAAVVGLVVLPMVAGYKSMKREIAWRRALMTPVKVGQRWKYRSGMKRGVVLEILDVNEHRIKVGRPGQEAGWSRVEWKSAVKNGLRQVNTPKTEN